jgi:hypothetical protein
MMGVSELVLLSMNIGGDMGDMWTRFIKERLPDKKVTMALEEFLMGMPWEQIDQLRAMLREQKISAINRDEVAAFLREAPEQALTLDAAEEGEDDHVKVESDLSDFYMAYTVRRDNARVRKRLHLPGPHFTLEDHYMAFALDHVDQMRFNEALMGS